MRRILLLRSRPWLSSAALHAVILLILGMCSSIARHEVGEFYLVSTFNDREVEHIESLDIAPLDIPPPDAFTVFSVPPPADLPEINSPLFAEVVPTLPISFAVQSGQRSKREALGARNVEFCGAVAQGDRVAFVLDASGSMGHSTPQSTVPSRFQLAAEELMRAVEGLYPDQSFCVILFNRHCHPMFDVPPKATQLIPASDANKERLRKWLTTIQPTGGTDPKESLELTVSLAPDLIFLLTDGVFRDYSGQRRRMHRDFRTINAARIPIHAIAFKERSRIGVLKRMAADSRGTYRFVP